MDSDSARHILQRRGPGGLKHIETRCLAIQQWQHSGLKHIRKSSGHEEQHRRSLHETSGWIANTIACEEAWASNPRWYKWYEWNERGRLRNGDD